MRAYCRLEFQILLLVESNAYLAIQVLVAFERGHMCSIAFHTSGLLMIREPTINNNNRIRVWLDLDRRGLSHSDGNSVHVYRGATRASGHIG
jgi:hypothetical protein